MDLHRLKQHNNTPPVTFPHAPRDGNVAVRVQLVDGELTYRTYTDIVDMLNVSGRGVLWFCDCPETVGRRLGVKNGR